MKKSEKRDNLHTTLQAWCFWTSHPDGTPKVEVLWCITGLLQYNEEIGLITKKELERITDVIAQFQFGGMAAYKFREKFLEAIREVFKKDILKTMETSNEKGGTKC